MTAIHKLPGDVTSLSDFAAVPGIGCLAVNTFVLQAEQIVVVDTGLSTADKDYLSDLSGVVDPADVEWIWLTHPDRDHTGGLFALLEAAPKARLVTTFLGVGIMSTQWEVPMGRVHLVNPGQSLDVGDRTLTAFRPPVFDSPATLGFFDNKTGTMFSSDCFGGPLETPDLAIGPDVRDAGDVTGAQHLWTSIDSPWIHNVDRAKYQATIDPVRAMAPTTVLSTHLPPVLDNTDALFDVLASAPEAAPFVGPDQAALEQMLAMLQGAP